MPPSAPERDLRRIVAELAGLHGDDLAAILAELGADERRTVETLLHEYKVGTSAVDAAPPVQDPMFDATRLSPWLAARMRDTHGVTPHARRTLQACAARICPAPQPSAPTSRIRGGRSSSRATR